MRKKWIYGIWMIFFPLFADDYSTFVNRRQHGAPTHECECGKSSVVARSVHSQRLTMLPISPSKPTCSRHGSRKHTIPEPFNNSEVFLVALVLAGTASVPLIQSFTPSTRVTWANADNPNDAKRMPNLGITRSTPRVKPQRQMSTRKTILNLNGKHSQKFINAYDLAAHRHIEHEKLKWREPRIEITF